MQMMELHPNIEEILIDMLRVGFFAEGINFRSINLIIKSDLISNSH